MKTITVESMVEQALGNSRDRITFSEEVYFGLTNPFSSEMITWANSLREVVKDLLGADWKDVNKRSIIIKKETEKSSTESKLVRVLDGMGVCISNHCNIEKCYIGLFNEINAHTIPMVFDSSLLFDMDKNPIIKRHGEYFVNGKAMKDNVDLQKGLMKLEDIVIAKDGYKFKEKKGKVFIINLGLPLIVDELFESSAEELCAVIFHEIGHNFQQMLRGANQMFIDTYMKSHIAYLGTRKFFDIFGMIESVIMHSSLKDAINAAECSNKARYSMIRAILFSIITVNRDGSFTTRDDIGEYERDNLMKVIEAAKSNGSYNKLSMLIRVMSTIGQTFLKMLKLITLPLSLAYNHCLRNDLHKNYGQIIKENKSYEQFADTFAVAYGFGGSSSKFYIEVQKYIRTMNRPKSLAILNYIPLISTIEAIDDIRTRELYSNIHGYDESHVRIAQAYRVLEYELSNNSGLTPQQKKEITTHMVVLKEDYEFFKKLEMDNFRENPSLVKFIMKKFRSGDISDVANESGIVEGVLEAIDSYEKNPSIKEPKIVEDMKKSIGTDLKTTTSFSDKLILGFRNTIADSILFKRLIKDL